MCTPNIIERVNALQAQQQQEHAMSQSLSMLTPEQRMQMNVEPIYSRVSDGISQIPREQPVYFNTEPIEEPLYSAGTQNAIANSLSPLTAIFEPTPMISRVVSRMPAQGLTSTASRPLPMYQK